MLTELLEKDAIPFETLHTRYGPLLELVRTLLGVVPNCDRYLEIWPAAFRTYNVMVPNLINLPFLLWGAGAPRDKVGLAMYVSSRAASCAYCSAHCCSFALRRGATVDQVRSALEDQQALSSADRAVVQMASALSTVPATLDESIRVELRRHFSEADVEWLVLSVSMMGFLNKYMDALGVPLEEPVVSEVDPVIASSGWTPGQHFSGPIKQGSPPGQDSLLKRAKVAQFAPQALKLDKAWTAGVPDRWPEVGDYLREKTGHDFPVLSRIRHRRAVRAVATMIKDNFGDSVVGLGEKLSAGLVYARIVDDSSLGEELRAVGAQELPDSPVQTLARAVSPSPAVVDQTTVDSCRSLPPAGIVEVVSFVSVLQLLHRLSTYYPAAQS